MTLDAAVAEQVEDDEILALGGGVECGCCFGEYRFVSVLVSEIYDALL